MRDGRSPGWIDTGDSSSPESIAGDSASTVPSSLIICAIVRKGLDNSGQQQIGRGVDGEWDQLMAAGIQLSKEKSEEMTGRRGRCSSSHENGESVKAVVVCWFETRSLG